MNRMTVKRRCIVSGCTVFISKGSRCSEHRQEQRRKYYREWPSIARKAIDHHRLIHGDICPGWRIPSHPIEQSE
jgi:hypothetical protein